MLSLKRINTSFYVFCEKYNMIILYSEQHNDINIALGLQITAIKRNYSILAVNDTEGSLLRGKLTEMPDLEEVLAAPATMAKLKAYYIKLVIHTIYRREIIIPFNYKKRIK
jgi:hypothetical protein